MKYIIKLYTFIFLSVGICHAQDIAVSGKVTDSNGDGLPGANVVIKNTTNGVITDLDGNYEIAAPADAILQYTYVGYVTQEISVNNQTIIDIKMELDTRQVEEVVVVGYGVQKKASSVASIAQVRGDDLLQSGNSGSVVSSMQGMMAGVTVSDPTGRAGTDGTDITIRGLGTWENSSPLILVDGIERNMNDLDPNEIESISILKDASATAVFGARGGNGVILITSKRGKVSKPKIGFTTNFGFKSFTVEPEFASHVESMEMFNQAVATDGLWDMHLDEDHIQAWRDNADQAGPYNPYFPEVNWWDEIVKDVAYQQQYNLNVRGGSKLVKYFVSLGYLQEGDMYNLEPQEAYDPSNKYRRFNWRSNLDFNLTKSTVFSVNIAGNYGIQNQNADIGKFGDDHVTVGEEKFFDRFYTGQRNLYPIKNPDGTWGVEDYGDGNGNVYMLMHMGADNKRSFNSFLDLRLEQDLSMLTKGLKIKGGLSYTAASMYTRKYSIMEGEKYGQNQYERYYYGYDVTQPNGDGIYAAVDTVRFPLDGDATGLPTTVQEDAIVPGKYKRDLYYNVSLEYNREFGKHNVTGLALFSRSEDNRLDTKELFNWKHRQEDWVGRVTYGYDGRYLLEVNGAKNGSENFPEGNRFGTFYSVTGGYRISEESFIKDRIGDYLTNLKVKYSYGTSGNDHIKESDRFTYYQYYNQVVNNNGKLIPVNLGYNSLIEWEPLYHEGELANANLTWEHVTTKNLGIEFGFFNKIIGEIDFYENYREGILSPRTLPTTVTSKTGYANVGESKNHGMELQLKYRDKIGQHFLYYIKGSYSFTENRVIVRNDGRATPEYQKDAGKPIKSWEVEQFIADGFIQDVDELYMASNDISYTGLRTPGDLIFYDFNGDGIVDDQDKVRPDKMNQPYKTYNFGFGVDYRGLSISVLFYGVYDIYKFLDGALLWDLQGSTNEYYQANADVNDSWTFANASTASKPAVHVYSKDNYNKRNSSYTYRDASFLRLKNIEVSYTLKKSWVEQIGFGNMTIYANGNNLYTWTKYNRNIDPETKKTGVYPIVRRANIGLRATFK